MNYYLVKNNALFGAYDYKGLDLDQFIAGSQVYNDADNEFAVASTEDFQTVNADVTQLTEEDYSAYRETYLPKPSTPATADSVEELKAQNDTLSEYILDVDYRLIMVELGL